MHPGAPRCRIGHRRHGRVVVPRLAPIVASSSQPRRVVARRRRVVFVASSSPPRRRRRQPVHRRPSCASVTAVSFRAARPSPLAVVAAAHHEAFTRVHLTQRRAALQPWFEVSQLPDLALRSAFLTGHRQSVLVLYQSLDRSHRPDHHAVASVWAHRLGRFRTGGSDQGSSP